MRCFAATLQSVYDLCSAKRAAVSVPAAGVINKTCIALVAARKNHDSDLDIPNSEICRVDVNRTADAQKLSPGREQVLWRDNDPVI
jgi:hypothetical protein